jgi:hypothetical protein
MGMALQEGVFRIRAGINCGSKRSTWMILNKPSPWQPVPAGAEILPSECCREKVIFLAFYNGYGYPSDYLQIDG